MSSHRLRLILAAFVLASVGGAARASTTITGGNIINQKWTVAGSPYVVHGDITIPSSSFLIVEAGVEIQVASGDVQAAGLDKTRVEITVDGTLDIIGTSAQPVTLHGQSTSGGAWYGIVVNADATQADLEYATVADAQIGVTSAAAGQAFSTKQVTFSKNGTGIYVSTGAPTLDSFTVEGSAAYGVSVSDLAGVTLSNCLVTGNPVGIAYGGYH